MRFQELRLEAFGPFTGQSIEFGAAAKSDLHVVVGPNEAGKSSTLRAIDAFLFGIPVQTPDAFIHAYARLRITGVLQAAGEEPLTLTRVKGNKDTLLDAAGKPVSEVAIERLLDGVGRQDFQRLYLLNAKLLADGGESLLTGGGESGVSILGATLGSSDLPTIRKRLRERADAIYKVAGRKPPLNAALSAYTGHLRDAKQLAVAPQAYSECNELVKRIAAQRDAERKTVSEIELRVQTLQRLSSVTAPFARRRQLRTELAAYGDVPVLEGDAGARRELALAAKRTADGAISESNAEIERLERELRELSGTDAVAQQPPDPQLLDSLTDWSRALEQAIPGFLAARQRLDEVQKDQMNLIAAAGQLEPAVSESQLRDAPLPPRGEIEQFAEDQRRLAARFDDARIKHDRAQAVSEDSRARWRLRCWLALPALLSVIALKVTALVSHGSLAVEIVVVLFVLLITVLSLPALDRVVQPWRAELDRQRDLSQQELQQLELERQELERRWLECWSHSGLTPSPAAADMLAWRNELTRLKSELAKTDQQLAHEREKIGETQRLSDKLREALRQAGSEVDAERPPDQLPPDQLLKRAAEQLDTAREANARRKDLAAKQAQLKLAGEKLKRQRATRDEAISTLAALCASARCERVEDLPEIERRAAARDELRRELADREREIVEHGQRPLDELEQELSGRDADLLAAELEREQRSLREARDRYDKLGREQAAAEAERDHLDTGTAAASARAAAELDAAAIAELVERYLAAVSASTLLGRAIARHRAESASPILTRAAELLRQLTNGSLADLEVSDRDSGQPVIRARRGSGDGAPLTAALDVSELSDGTRDQLYLALRLAALEHQLRTRQPQPLLLDDVLASYDEARVTAALEAFASVAQHTQVILFTHHEQVAEAAAALLPSAARVHRLER